MTDRILRFLTVSFLIIAVFFGISIDAISDETPLAYAFNEYLDDNDDDERLNEHQSFSLSVLLASAPHYLCGIDNDTRFHGASRTVSKAKAQFAAAIPIERPLPAPLLIHYSRLDDARFSCLQRTRLPYSGLSPPFPS
ncbi:MAG: hypothetical protein M0042_05525 [Nitrospiraceae bacterium]|nr:hypothetical protein [Nitrospiraceae bacterium]